MGSWGWRQWRGGSSGAAATVVWQGMAGAEQKIWRWAMLERVEEMAASGYGRKGGEQGLGRFHTEDMIPGWRCVGCGHGVWDVH